MTDYVAARPVVWWNETVDVSVQLRIIQIRDLVSIYYPGPDWSFKLLFTNHANLNC